MSVLVWDAVGGGLLGLHNYVTSPDKGQGGDQQQHQQQQQRRRHRIGGIIGAEWVGEERRELMTANCFFLMEKAQHKRCLITCRRQLGRRVYQRSTMVRRLGH